MAENNVDVIVSDMRMPGMDGASLLTKVQEEYPRTIRIMLTGQADEESILRTVGVVHQFISKPSTPETLREIIDRACALQDLMENEQLKSVVSGIGQLPSLPEVYSKLQNKMKDPECSLADVAAIIEQDLAMSTKVLQLVNSSFFGFFKNIDSPTRAVNLLGLDTVKALVLSVGIFSEIKPLNAKHFSIQQLWDHSVAVAAYTKKIVQTETDSKEMLDHSFLAGFLHDIGKLILVSSLTDKLNATHSDVGGYLLGLWGLPGDAVETAAFHHRLDHYPNPSFCPPLAVHAADAIYYRLHPEKAPGEIMLSMEYLEKAGVSNRFEHWQELCEELGL